jgi:hypothetical protein
MAMDALYPRVDGAWLSQSQAGELGKAEGPSFSLRKYDCQLTFAPWPTPRSRQMIESFRLHYVYSDGGTCSAKEWNKIIKHYCYPLGVAHEESLVQVGRSASPPDR